ncbi:hypothetical protein WN093_06605 [Gammaproteobacteria bacterium AS21]
MGYKVFSINQNGERSEIDAQSIIIELDEGKCLELDVNPHPNHHGALPISITLDLNKPINANAHSIFNIKPAASNVIHLHVEKIASYK